MAISLGILGVSGRMGRKILTSALLDPAITLAGGFAGPLSNYLGTDLGSLIASPPMGLAVTDCLETLLSETDVLIDFSTPEATQDLLEKILPWKKPLVIGTTGLSEETLLLMKEVSQQIPILFSANFSLGMAACLQAAALLSNMLKKTFAVDIIETHHIHKKDRPSGTALALAEATGSSDNIHSIREGEVLGEHRLLFTNKRESVELKHEVFSRDTFAEGALFAAKTLVAKPPGLYSLKDLFT